MATENSRPMPRQPETSYDLFDEACDPHQSIATALEHLGRLDSETMTEVEQTLAAAVRQLCVAVMHQAAGEST